MTARTRERTSVSVDVYYELLTAAATTVDALIHKVTLPLNTAAIGVPSAQVFTYDTGSDTAGERNTMDQHTMTAHSHYANLGRG